MAHYINDHIHRSTYSHPNRLPESFGKHTPTNLEGTIVDAGCSHGYTTNYLAECNPRADIIGVDINEKIIESARTRIKQDSKVHFLHCNFYNIDKYFSTRSVTALVAANNLLCISEMLPHNKLKRIFAGFYSVLAPEGKLYLGYMGRGIIMQKEKNCFSLFALHQTNIDDHAELSLAFSSLKI